MEFRERFDYFFRNNGTQNTKAEFRIAKPDILKNNLENKKIRIPKFYTNNLAVPLFIPDRLTKNDTSYFNVTTESTTLDTIYVNNSITVNSLKYYIILSDINGDKSIVIFLRHIPVNQDALTPPISPIIDDDTYYRTPYYYYYDFTFFLELVQDAISQAYATYSGNPNDAVIYRPIIWQNEKFQFFSYQGVLASPPALNWNIDFSSSLIELLPFKNVLTPQGHHRLVFETIPATINGLPYYEVDANFYDTIFPFTQLLFRSEDANLNPINFIDDFALTSNAQASIFENSILAFDIDTNNFQGVYNFYKYVNNEDTTWVNFDGSKDVKNHLTLQLYLRLKNNIVIPYMLKPKELCKISIEVKYEESQ